MKKRLLVSVSVFVFAALSLHAQGTPVFDFASLMQAIDQFYATYDHINATIEQVKNTYEQLQKQIEMVKNMNWDDIGLAMSNHNGIPDIRDPINSAARAVDDNLNLLNNVQDTLTKKTVSFGGKKYTLGGLFGLGGVYGQQSDNTTIFDLPKNIADFAGESSKEAVAGWAGNLSYRQKEAIARRHGLSPENYAKIRIVEEQGNALIKDLFTTGTNENLAAVVARAVKNQSAIQSMTAAAGESMVAQQQAATQALLSVSADINRLNIGLSHVAGYLGHKAIMEQMEKESRAEAGSLPLSLSSGTHSSYGWVQNRSEKYALTSSSKSACLLLS
ncbi:MAG: type IV secretion system protein, partial [Treponema sp.]|nr:type IV secretion system protein [Treponema sp.]